MLRMHTFPPACFAPADAMYKLVQSKDKGLSCVTLGWAMCNAAAFQTCEQQEALKPSVLLLQIAAQKEMVQEQNERCRDLEAATRQLDERCHDLKEAAAGHEARAREVAAEVVKGNRIIEKLTVSHYISSSQVHS